MHCVDLGESFPTSIYLQKSASIQPRTSPWKFGGKFNSIFIRLLPTQASPPRGAPVDAPARGPAPATKTEVEALSRSGFGEVAQGNGITRRHTANHSRNSLHESEKVNRQRNKAAGEEVFNSLDSPPTSDTRAADGTGDVANGQWISNAIVSRKEANLLGRKSWHSRIHCIVCLTILAVAVLLVGFSLGLF